MNPEINNIQTLREIIGKLLQTYVAKFVRSIVLNRFPIYALNYNNSRNNGVFPKWSRTFAEFSEFRETDKSLKHEFGLNFKDPISQKCLAGTVVACQFLTPRGGWVAGSSPFNVNFFFVTEFSEFSEKHLGKTPMKLIG